jgi:hypothetical protein
MVNTGYKGTRLPHDLLLVHERSDHYSLQPAKAMAIDGKMSTLDTFDQKLNEQCNA